MLKTIDPESVHCIVSSPPFWCQRSYDTEPVVWGGKQNCLHDFNEKNVCGTCSAWRGEFGRENLHDCLAWARKETPCGNCYVCNSRLVFRELHRVLRKDGVCFWNIGDMWATSPPGNKNNRKSLSSWLGRSDKSFDTISKGYLTKKNTIVPGLKRKDLAMIPARVALALQSDGWYLRSEIVWEKTIYRPEPIHGRPTKNHEMVYMLTKSPKYFYDEMAERTTKNKPTVWKLTPKTKTGGHSAPMAQQLAESCILLGSSECCCSKCGSPWVKKVGKRNVGKTYPERYVESFGPSCDCNAEKKPCVVLDPFCGGGTTLMAAKRLGRDGIGIELNAGYAKSAEENLLT